MTNARYHTFRLQNLFVSCPNIFIKQPYSIFFLVWSAVPIIYILSPSPFIFVSVFLLRQEKNCGKRAKQRVCALLSSESLHSVLTSVVPAPIFSSSKTISLFCHVLFNCGTHIYIVQCAICIERREKYSRYSGEMITKRIAYNGNSSSEMSQ